MAGGRCLRRGIIRKLGTSCTRSRRSTCRRSTASAAGNSARVWSCGRKSSCSCIKTSWTSGAPAAGSRKPIGTALRRAAASMHQMLDEPPLSDNVDSAPGNKIVIQARPDEPSPHRPLRGRSVRRRGVCGSLGSWLLDDLLRPAKRLMRGSPACWPAIKRATRRIGGQPSGTVVLPTATQTMRWSGGLSIYCMALTCLLALTASSCTTTTRCIAGSACSAAAAGYSHPGEDTR